MVELFGVTLPLLLALAWCGAETAVHVAVLVVLVVEVVVVCLLMLCVGVADVM